MGHLAVHHNSFRNNNLGGSSQALDSGFDNTWYDYQTFEGNFWNDWVVGSYSIDGTANAVDPYPLIVDPWA